MQGHGMHNHFLMTKSSPMLIVVLIEKDVVGPTRTELPGKLSFRLSRRTNDRDQNVFPCH